MIRVSHVSSPTRGVREHAKVTIRVHACLRGGLADRGVRCQHAPQYDDEAASAASLVPEAGFAGADVRFTTCGCSAASPPLPSRVGSAVARRRKSSLMLKPSLAEVSINMISCTRVRGLRHAQLSVRDVGSAHGSMPYSRWWVKHVPAPQP